MKADLLGLISDREELAALDPAARRLALRSVLASAAAPDETQDLVGQFSDWIDGFGPLTQLMEDPDVSDLLVNAPDEVWVERNGHLERESVAFEGPEELADLIERLLGSAGVRADASQPIADARLKDGSRFHVVLPPLSGAHPLLSIRRFPSRAFSLDDLEEKGFVTSEQGEALADAVRERRTIVVGGGTGAGKTTLVNALLGCVADTERVVVIEEVPELRPVCAHWVSLITRSPNVEGRGAVDQAALLRAALRMRPDRIVLGEVRGAEASIALHAMSTGHEGSMLTIHSRSAAEIQQRLVDLAAMHERAPSHSALARRVETSLDVMVQVSRLGGRRRIVDIVGP